jgi:hypothetical protein
MRERRKERREEEGKEGGERHGIESLCTPKITCPPLVAPLVSPSLVGEPRSDARLQYNRRPLRALTTCT